MPIPPFTKEGLLPPGFHSAEMAELEKKLCFSAKRRTLIDGLRLVADEWEIIMFKIKSDDQRQKTAKQIELFNQQIENVRQKKGAAVAELFAKSVRHHLSDLKEQIKAYDALKTGGLEPLGKCQLSEVGPYLVKARIASGMTQADLAKKLSVSQPMVHKYERVEYQGARADTLAKVAEVLRVSLNLDLNFGAPNK